MNGLSPERIYASSLWIAHLLQTLFRDVHEFLRPGMMASIIKGAPISDGALIASALVLQIPIWMVAFSLILPQTWFARCTLIGALVMLFGTLGFGVEDGDDVVFLLARCVPLLLLICVVIGWPQQKPLAN